jgi:hypothetical protein
MLSFKQHLRKAYFLRVRHQQAYIKHAYEVRNKMVVKTFSN